MERTVKRNEKKMLIENILLREDDIQQAVTFVLGKAFSENDQRALKVGVKTVWKKLEASDKQLLLKAPDNP